MRQRHGKRDESKHRDEAINGRIGRADYGKSRKANWLLGKIWVLTLREILRALKASDWKENLWRPEKQRENDI